MIIILQLAEEETLVTIERQDDWFTATAMQPVDSASLPSNMLVHCRKYLAIILLLSFEIIIRH